MPNRNYGTNTETLLLLAWCSTLDLQALLQKDQQARPHKYPEKADFDGWLPVFPEDMLKEQIMEALSCLQGGTYDPVLLHLVQYCLLFVSVEDIAATIGLKDQARALHGFFYSDDPFLRHTTEEQPANSPENETDAFLQSLSIHAVLRERLIQLSQIWSNNVCLGAQCLSVFFLEYTHMLFRHREAPFFVVEFLGRSLQQVDWHTIAAHIQGVDSFSCECSTSEPLSEHEGVLPVPLFQELLTLAGEEIRQASRRLPEDLRRKALFLSGLCTDMAVSKQVQCPRCQQLVPHLVHSLDRCTDCVRRDFGLEMGTDGRLVRQKP
jgi:hypothetical protein